MEKIEGFMVFITLTIFVSASVIFIVLYMESDQENKTFKQILLTDINSVPVAGMSEKGSQLYLEASMSYEDTNYKSVESNCRLARGWFSDANEGYLDLKSELVISSDEPLILKYAELLEVLAEIQWNMFEACEHFESASRYYDTYYNTDVPIDDASFEQGGGEIEAMNEKIALHDKNVREYNSLLSDYRVELERMIK